MSIERLPEALATKPDRQLIRVASYILAAVVLGTDKLLGGSWSSFAVAAALITAMFILLPAELPRGNARLRILAVLQSIRGLSSGYRMMAALLIVCIITFLATNFSSVVGRQFNLSLLSILLCSFFFGLRISIVTWLASFLLIYLFVIPPTSHLGIASLADFANLIVYIYLSLVALTIPTLIRATSCLV